MPYFQCYKIYTRYSMVLTQDCTDPIINALGLRRSCSKALIYIINIFLMASIRRKPQASAWPSSGLDSSYTITIRCITMMQKLHSEVNIRDLIFVITYVAQTSQDCDVTTVPFRHLVFNGNITSSQSRRWLYRHLPQTRITDSQEFHERQFI